MSTSMEIDPRFALAQAGDQQALSELTAEHDGLVGFFLQMLWCADPALDEEDLRQAGRTGLVTAIMKYRPVARFSSYARYHIRGAVLEVIGKYRRRGGMGAHISWDEPRGHDALYTIGETLADDRVQPADEAYATVEQALQLRRALQILPERERQIMTWWAYDGQTYDQIGETLGLSRERVRQLRERALRRLRSNTILMERIA